MGMGLEFKPADFMKAMRSAGLKEERIRRIESLFSRKDNALSDSELLEAMVDMDLDIHTIIDAFSRIGISKETSIGIHEELGRKRAGLGADIRVLEVGD
jgi:hypothetical protein